MIPILIVAGLALAGAVVYTFWDEIKKYLKQAYEKIKEVLSATIVGVTTYLQTRDLVEGVKAAYKFYSKNKAGKWQETVLTKTISAQDVPEHIRRKLEATTDEVDVSDELELELQ